MRALLFIFSLSAFQLSAFGAAGDIVSCLIRPDGWSIDLAFSGMNTNGTYAMGYATNYTGTPKIVLTVYSPGFDDTGTSNWTSRIVYGTTNIAKPYPNNAATDETLSNEADYTAGNVTNRIGLSEWIGPTDIVSNATFSASIYTAGGTPNNANSSITVQNLSQAPWPDVVFHWTKPGCQQETGSVMRLHAFAAHPSAQQGRPVRVVKFIVTDEHSVKVTNTVTTMSLAAAGTLPWTELTPTGEYLTSFALSQFTAHDQLRCDVIAYPWLGTNILNTTLDRYAMPTPQPAAITNLCDPNNNYSGFIGVAAVGGSDTDGRATNVAPHLVNSAHYFATIEQAWQFLAASNNAHASPTTHNDVGGGVVYVRAGIVTWLGGTVSAGGVPKCYGTTANYPGDVVEFTTASGSTDLTDRVRIEGIKIGSGNLFNGIQHLWFNNCIFSNAATATFQSSPMVYITGGSVTNIGQGLRGFGGSQNTSVMLRSVMLDGFGGVARPYLMMGCIKPNTNGANFNITFDVSSQTAPFSPVVLYNNILYGFKNIGTPWLDTQLFSSVSNGVVIANNVFEVDISSGQPWNIGTVNTSSQTNFMVWNNSFIGGKVNIAYNDVGSAASYKWLWSVRNNLFDNWNLKSDTFVTADGGRIGNWPVLYGCGLSGNQMGEITSVGSAANFMNRFAGLSTRMRTATGADIQGYVDRQSFAGSTTPTTGSGNYRVTSVSAVQQLARVVVLPFDVEGNHRGAYDPPGAYSSASPRKGDFF